MKKRSFVLWYVVWSLSASIVFEQGGSQEDSAEQPTFMRVPQGDGEPQSLFAYGNIELEMMELDVISVFNDYFIRTLLCSSCFQCNH